MGQNLEPPKMCGNQEKEQQCLMVLCFLKQNQYEDLGFHQQQFKQKLNIFPSIIINPFRIFVNDGEVFQTSLEFQEYIQCVNLEGNLKRIVIFIDVNSQEQFIHNYCKIILNDIYNQMIDIVIFDARINAYQQDYQQLKEYFQNITIFTNKQECFLNILQNCKEQYSYGNQYLNHKSTQMEDNIIQNITKFIEYQLAILNSYQYESVIQFENFYKQFVDLRNSIFQKNFVSLPQHQRNNWVLQCKFNYKIMEQISQYTNQVFDLIYKLIKQFESKFYFCQICKIYVYTSGKNYYNSVFFNGQFKNKSCQNCDFTQSSIDNLTNLYDQQRKCFQIDHCLQYLNQSQLVQSENSPSKIVDNFNHHIILIGKSGVGKTTLFNLLCNGSVQRFNEPTQEPVVKKCLNSNLTIMDTPPFELENKDLIENDEKIKQTFSNILTKKQVSQIFIVVKYDRLPAMKQSMLGCLKFLGSFRDKISIIIFNDDQRLVNEQQKDLEQSFDTNRILIFNLRDAQVKFNKEIENHLFHLKAKLEQLNIQNTDFDIKKIKKEQKVMFKKLENHFRIQKVETSVNDLIQENKSISLKIEQLNKEQLELIKKLNSNQQKIQDSFNNMVKEQNNSNLLIKFD